MTKIPTATAAVAATLVSGMAFMGASNALASEPLRLNAVQMDVVTAGTAYQQTTAVGLAMGEKETLTFTDTTADAVAKNEKNASATGVALTVAAGDVVAATEGGSHSHVGDDKTYAGVIATTEGLALGDAYSEGGILTSARTTGVVHRAKGKAYQIVDGNVVYATATVVPYGEGTFVKTSGPTTVSTNEPGLIEASGSIMVVNPPGLDGRGIPGKGKGVGK